jgi:hypothetical protein
MITTALNLQKATQNRDQLHIDKHRLKYSELLEKILSYDFSSNFRHKEHPLLMYLSENNCQTIAEFLRLYNK